MNVTKQEVVCPQCLSEGAKLWPWPVNLRGAVFTLLLRKSDRCADFHRFMFETDPDVIVGRWTGDKVDIVGHDDSSGLYQESKCFRNISHDLAKVWNRLVALPELKLMPKDDCRCRDIDD